MHGPAAGDYTTMNAQTLGQQPEYDAIRLDQRKDDSGEYLYVA